MRIAVTGATGFVGGAIAAAAEGRGWEVVRFARKHGNGLTFWDLTQDPPTRLPVVDAVVHAAAHVADWGDRAVFHRVNVQGTQAVAAAYQATRFVHISSSSVYPWWEACVDRAEDEVATRHLSPYSYTKARADVEARKHSNSVVLRPHGVYGPGDRTLLPRMLANIGRVPGAWRPLLSVGHAGILHQLTHIDNLAAAALAGCESGLRGAVNVADAEPVALGHVLREVLLAVGRPDVLVRYLPWTTAMTVATASEVLARLMGRPPRLTRYAVSQLGMQRTYNLDRLHEGLGVAPVRTTLVDAGKWLESVD